MALCKPEIIDLLNSKYVALSLDNFLEQFPNEAAKPARRSADRWPAETVARGDKIMASLKAAMLAQGGAVSAFVLGPDGEQVAIGMPMVTKPDEYLLAFLQQYAAAAPSASGASLPRYVSHGVNDPGPNGIQLRVVSRYADDVSLEVLAKFNPRASSITRSASGFHSLYAPAFAGPARDWIVLDETQWKALLPHPGARLGDSYEVSAATAAQLLVHLCPAVSPMFLDTRQIRKARLIATVAAIDDARVHVHLDGEVEMVNPGPMDDMMGVVVPAVEANRVVASVSGFVEVDAAFQGIRNMQLATISASHRSPGSDLPYTAVAYLYPRR